MNEGELGETKSFWKIFGEMAILIIVAFITMSVGYQIGYTGGYNYADGWWTDYTNQSCFCTEPGELTHATKLSTVAELPMFDVPEEAYNDSNS